MRNTEKGIHCSTEGRIRFSKQNKQGTYTRTQTQTFQKVHGKNEIKNVYCGVQKFFK